MNLNSPVTPMVALGVASYANNWYNTGSVTDVKPLLFAGLSALFLEAFAAIPGMEPAATLLGWTAFIGMMISPVQNPSPIQNLINIGTSAGKTSTTPASKATPASKTTKKGSSNG
jgi:hypothetical protein